MGRYVSQVIAWSGHPSKYYSRKCYSHYIVMQTLSTTAKHTPTHSKTSSLTTIHEQISVLVFLREDFFSGNFLHFLEGADNNLDKNVCFTHKYGIIFNGNIAFKSNMLLFVTFILLYYELM